MKAVCKWLIDFQKNYMIAIYTILNIIFFFFEVEKIIENVYWYMRKSHLKISSSRIKKDNILNNL